MYDFYPAFEERITRLMESNGLNQRNFAISLGLNNGTVSRWMNGQRVPEIKYLIMIAKKFHVSIDWLVGLQDDITNKLSPATQELITLYSGASNHDKLIVDTVLSHYKEKE